MNALEALFPQEDHRFQLGLRAGDPAVFFAPQDVSGRLLEERRRWLRADFSRHACLQPGGENLAEETRRLARAWGVSCPQTGDLLTDLGGALEPDLLWLAPDEAGELRLLGGVVCFPSSWALAEKLGQTMDFIHGPVPSLNQALGPKIGLFLSRLKPGQAYFRHNWGLAAVADLNLHPALQRPRLSLPLDPAGIWLRIEHQVLMAIAGGVLFGIRIEVHQLTEVCANPRVRAGLGRALATLPATMADYKGLGAIRGELSAWLGHRVVSDG